MICKNSRIVKINESYVNKYRNKFIKIIDENYENKVKPLLMLF